MNYQEHDRGGQEPPLHHEHTSWPRLKEKMLRQADAHVRADEVRELTEAGYRLAISDLEAWHESPGRSAGVSYAISAGISYAIDHLSERADEYWPQEEIT